MYYFVQTGQLLTGQLLTLYDCVCAVMWLLTAHDILLKNIATLINIHYSNWLQILILWLQYKINPQRHLHNHKWGVYISANNLITKNLKFLFITLLIQSYMEVYWDRGVNWSRLYHRDWYIYHPLFRADISSQSLSPAQMRSEFL